MTLWHLTNLIQIDLPAYTVRLCDGGVIFWGANVFRGRHATWGAVVGAESLTEGVGNEVPAFALTFAPAAAAEPSDLSQPGFQKARVRWWTAEWSRATCAVVGSPLVQFDGLLDQVELRIEFEKFEMEASVVSSAEKLFGARRGNGLSPTFHKSIWAGETGHDQATGLTIPRAWGVEAPPASSSSPNFTGGSSGGGSFFGEFR